MLLSVIFIILVVINFLIEGFTIFFYRFYQQSWIRDALRIVLFSLVEPIYPISITRFYYKLKRGKIPSMRVETQEAYPTHPPFSHSEIRFCHHCGQLLPYDAIYCPNCGRKVSLNP